MRIAAQLCADDSNFYSSRSITGLRRSTADLRFNLEAVCLAIRPESGQEPTIIERNAMVMGRRTAVVLVASFVVLLFSSAVSK